MEMTTNNKQITLDLIGMTERIIEDNCKPKDVREATRLVVEGIRSLNLRQIRKELKKSGFSFYLVSEEILRANERLEELQTYYNTQMTEKNREDLRCEYETIEKSVREYEIYPELMDFKYKIIEWCDKNYNKLISETYSSSITYNIKYISQIKNDIIEVYGKYVFDTKFSDSDKETLNKINNKDTRKRFERFFEEQHLHNDRYIPEVEMDDIIILDNTIYQIITCVMMDSNGWENGENDNRVRIDDKKYDKYRKYSLSPSTAFLGYNDNVLNLFDTLEELYNKVIEFGGKIYKTNGTNFKLKNK